MTQAEFAKGWKLLILQPWGWRYRSMTDQGAMTEETKTQMEFYFDKLKWAHCEAWWKVSSDYAQGKEWPSVGELKQSLALINRNFVKEIEETSTHESISMRDALAEQPELLATLKRVLS